MGAHRPAYVGLKPGTHQWMAVWKEYPALQPAMLSYAKLLNQGIMLVDDLPLIDKPWVRVRNSSLKSIASCNTQAHLKYVLGLETKGEAHARQVGTAIHEAIADSFRGKSLEACFETFKREFPKSAPKDDRLGFENVSVIFSHWLESNPPGIFPFSTAPDWIELWVEKILSVEKGIILTAQIDMLARDPRTGGLYVIDHKTTGKVTDWWLKQWRLSSSLTGYYWIAQRLFPGQLVQGVSINAIELPKLSEPGKKCKKHGVDYKECRHLHPNHTRFVLQRTPALIEEWERSALWLGTRMRDLYDSYNSIEAIPYIRQQGMFSGGCTFCDYAEFCAAGRPLDWIGSELVQG